MVTGTRLWPLSRVGIAPGWLTATRGWTVQWDGWPPQGSFITKPRLLQCLLMPTINTKTQHNHGHFPSASPLLALRWGSPPQPGKTRESLGSSTRHHPGWGPQLCQALVPLSSPSRLMLTSRVALYYLVGKGHVTAPRCSPSMPNPAPRNPDATVNRSSFMRSYTLTQAVRLLSHPCGLALEPECRFVHAFPSNEVWDKRADFPGRERCSWEVTAVRWPQVSCGASSRSDHAHAARQVQPANSHNFGCNLLKLFHSP